MTTQTQKSHLTFKSFPLLLAFSGMLGFANATQASELAKPTLEEIRDICEAQEVLLESLYVNYRVTSEIEDTAENASKHVGIVSLIDETHEYAFKGTKRYFSLKRSDSLADINKELETIDGSGNNINVPANLVVAFDGNTLLRRGAGGQAASIGNGVSNADDSGYFNPQYMGLAFKLLPDVINTANTRAENRLSGAISAGNCTLRPEMEQIEGVDCVVIDVTQPMKMTYWCDPALNFAVRQQVVCHPGSTEPALRSICSEFVEVCDGTWFTTHAITERFARPPVPESLRDKPLVSYTLEVLDIHANDVPEDLFTLQIPAGTIVNDYSNGELDESGKKVAMTFHMPAGGKTLEETVNQVKKRREKKSATSIASRYGFVLMNLVFGICVVAIFLYVRMRKRNVVAEN